MASDRKLEHLALAEKAQIDIAQLDDRFNYEPLLAAHPSRGEQEINLNFAGFSLGAPLWISSVTGGTGKAAFINKNFARVANDFKIGLGLGSCRCLLDSDQYFADFNLKPLMPHSPLFANLGIAQIEHLLLQSSGKERLVALLDRLQVDGLIVHVNPLQEWFQPEGDRFLRPPLETLEELLELVPLPIIVKEVGQGMGPRSLEYLMQLPLAAIEFAAFGGTNFTRLEQLRGTKDADSAQESLAYVGHSAEEMVVMINEILRRAPQQKMVSNFIISGGIKTFLDGYYLCQKLNACAIYGQAKQMLHHAAISYEALATYVEQQIAGLTFAYRFLEVK